MPFGLSNIPSTFQKLMELVLRGLHWSTCLVYLDDIIIIIVFSQMVGEHLQRLEEVLARLQQAGLKIKPSKCGSTSTPFSGRVLRKIPEKLAVFLVGFPL